MTLSDRELLFIKEADEYWKSLEIGTPEALRDWQARCYIPEDLINQFHDKHSRGEVGPVSQEKLIRCFESTSTQLALDIIANKLPDSLKDMHENPSEDPSQQEYRRQSAMMPFMFMQQVFHLALNPTGNPFLQRVASGVYVKAMRDLMQEMEHFPCADYKKYPEFALQVLTPYLPPHYMKLLRMEYGLMQAPQSLVDADTVELSTRTLLMNIADGRGNHGAQGR